MDGVQPVTNATRLDKAAKKEMCVLRLIVSIKTCPTIVDSYRNAIPKMALPTYCIRKLFSFAKGMTALPIRELGNSDEDGLVKPRNPKD